VSRTLTADVAETGDAGPRADKAARRRGNRWRSPILLGVLGFLGVLALWELLSLAGVFPPEHVPPPSTVLAELVVQLGTGAFWSDLGATMTGWAVGILIATALAVPIGMLIGSNIYLDRASKVTIEFLRPIPSVALVPLAILVYGISFDMKIFLVTFATFWPILIQSIYGIQDVDPVARDTARSFNLGRTAIFFKIELPSAAPYIATGLRLASSLAVILAITAELVAGVPGLGRAIMVAQASGANDLMYALIVATGLLGCGLTALSARAERRVLRWHQSHREVQGR